MFHAWYHVLSLSRPATLLGLLDQISEGIMFRRNVGMYSLYTAPYPRRLDSSATLPRFALQNTFIIIRVFWTFCNKAYRHFTSSLALSSLSLSLSLPLSLSHYLTYLPTQCLILYLSVYLFIYLPTYLHTIILVFLHMRVGTLIVTTIYLQLTQNRYMFRSFTVLQCSHQHCLQPVASDVEVVGYL